MRQVRRRACFQKFETNHSSGERPMKLFVTAIAIAAATPVAAQTAAPAHPAHETSPADPGGKSCCCCDKQKADKTDANKTKMECCEKANGDKPAAEHLEHQH
jgi:hypothetical protein